MDSRDAESHEIGVSNHIVKVIEVLAESPHSWEDAARVALREASRTLRNITSMYVKDMQAVVSDGRVSAWRVNTKVSFIVDDPTIGGSTMRYPKQQETVREGNYRPSRDDESFPDYDEYGLHGDDRRQYRGRESYEQQTRGGEAGRSGMWDQRFVPRDLDEPYRNNADEDRRGYQDIGRRQEFESSSRRGPDYPSRYRSDEPRYGFDSQDYLRSDRDRWESQGGGYPNDDYSRTDYGDRGYGGRNPPERSFGGTPDYAARNPRAYRGYSPRGTYHEETRSGGSRNWGGGNEPSFDQGRYANTQYDANASVRRTGRGPKGYKRSDDRIREDVCDRLSHQYDVDATDVEVTVSNAEVTLTGTVSDRDQKFRIEHIADGVGGVSEVHNQVRVRREVQNPSSSTQNTANPGSRNATNQSRSS